MEFTICIQLANDISQAEIFYPFIDHRGALELKMEFNEFKGGNKAMRYNEISFHCNKKYFQPVQEFLIASTSLIAEMRCYNKKAIVTSIKNEHCVYWKTSWGLLAVIARELKFCYHLNMS